MRKKIRSNFVLRSIVTKQNMLFRFGPIVLCSAVIISYYIFQPIFMKNITDMGLVRKDLNQTIRWSIVWGGYGVFICGVRVIQGNLSIVLQNDVKNRMYLKVFSCFIKNSSNS